MAVLTNIKMTVATALLLAACGGGAPAVQSKPAPATANAPADAAKPVCCESFGYGERMVECCSAFEWTKADECKVPAGFVGGNKRIVSDDHCPAK